MLKIAKKLKKKMLEVKKFEQIWLEFFEKILEKF